MKFETYILRGLLLGCSMLGLLILGAMIKATPPDTSLTSQASIGALLLSAPSSCVLPADGVICPRRG